MKSWIGRLQPTSRGTERSASLLCAFRHCNQDLEVSAHHQYYSGLPAVLHKEYNHVSSVLSRPLVVNV